MGKIELILGLSGDGLSHYTCLLQVISFSSAVSRSVVQIVLNS